MISLQLFGYDIYFLFCNFVIYSFIGWIYESCLVSIEHRTWVNRGFFNGPLIPLYGVGATFIYMCLSPAAEHPVFVFISGMALASALEFVTSYVMEKLFHAKWWDYSNFKFNFQGRICLLASLLWGFLAVVMIYILQPVMTRLIWSLPRPAGDIAACVILVLFLVDLVITVIGTIELDKALSSMQKIREDLKEYIESTRLYEAKEEWKSWFDQNSLSEWLSGFKKALGERMGQMAEKRDNKENTSPKDIEQKIDGYTVQYQKYLNRRRFIQKRLLKAFPNLKSENRESALKDYRDKLLEKRRKKG